MVVLSETKVASRTPDGDQRDAMQFKYRKFWAAAWGICRQGEECPLESDSGEIQSGLGGGRKDHRMQIRASCWSL